MAFISTPDDDKNAAGGAQGGSGAFVGGGGGGQGATTGVAASPAPSHSGSYTNLINYIGANQGTSGTMGQAAENVVDTAGQGANKALSDYQGNAKTAIDAGTVKMDPNILTSLNTNPGAINKSDFTRQYNASYGGPADASSVAGAADTYGAVSKAVGAANQTKNAAGVGGLLNTAYGTGGKQYSGGENQLDTFLTGSGDQGKAALAKAGSDWAGIGAQGDQATANINAQINNAKVTTGATRQGTQDAYRAAGLGLTNQFDAANQSLGGQNAADAAAYTAETAGLGSGDTGAASAIGLNQGAAAWAKANGMDPTSFITQGKAKGLGDVVSAEDQAKYAALQNLTGAGSAYDFSKTGGSGPYSVDQAKVDQANQGYLKSSLAAAPAPTMATKAFAQAPSGAAGPNAQTQAVEAATKAAKDLSPGQLPKTLSNYGGIASKALSSSVDTPAKIASAGQPIVVPYQDILDKVSNDPTVGLAKAIAPKISDPKKIKLY